MDNSWAKREYESQLFSGFDRQLLKEASRDLIKERIETFADDACRELTEALHLEPHQVELVRTRFDKIAHSFKENAQEPLRKIDEAFDQWLTIPDTVLLPMDEGCEYDESLRLKLVEECKELREKAMSLAAGKSLLKRELAIARSESLQRVMDLSSKVADDCLAIQVPSAAGSLIKDYLELCHVSDVVRDEFLSEDNMISPPAISIRSTDTLQT